MHIPDKHRANQLMESLDADRKAFVIALSSRYGVLSPDAMADHKALKHAFTLELQARWSPDVAAKIAYTSEDVLIPLAVRLVLMRDEELERERRRKLYQKTTWLAVGLILILLAFLTWRHLASPQSPPEPTTSTRTVSPPSSTTAAPSR